MTKEQFLNLNKEIGQLPPNPTIQKEFMENRFKDLGFSKESGYEAVQYYYSELYKAKENRQTIFEGKVILSDNDFGIVDNTSCYFKMTYERFNKRKELYFPSIPLPELILKANRDIDFTQTDPEYFANKLTELNSEYKENFVVTKEYIEQNPELGKINVGDINSKYPDWPKDPKLAFELFKNFYAYKFFLIQVSKFLENIGSWNQKAIKDELNIYNQFIEKADKFNLMEAAEQRANLRNQYQWYVLLANNYFLTHSIEKCNNNLVQNLYAKYFLFRELLYTKLETDTNSKQKKLFFKDFFDDRISPDLINNIQQEFKDLEGKKMAILIYLLQNKYRYITIIRNSKTESREHFVRELTGKNEFNMQYINRILKDNELQLNNDDPEIELIEERLTKIIEK
jgi:hypothetical protein